MHTLFVGVLIQYIHKREPSLSCIFALTFSIESLGSTYTAKWKDISACQCFCTSKIRPPPRLANLKGDGLPREGFDKNLHSGKWYKPTLIVGEEELRVVPFATWITWLSTPTCRPRGITHAQIQHEEQREQATADVVYRHNRVWNLTNEIAEWCRQGVSEMVGGYGGWILWMGVSDHERKARLQQNG